MGGYRLPEDVASSTAKEDIFAAAGTAITLMPESRNVDDLLGIAQAVLRHCPAKMEVRHPVEMWWRFPRLREFWGEGWMIHSPPALFFFSFFFEWRLARAH